MMLERKAKKKPLRCRLGFHGECKWDKMDKPIKSKREGKVYWIGTRQLRCTLCGEIVRTETWH